MPWLHGPPTNDSAARRWHSALKNAFVRRVSADQLDGAFRQLGLKHPTASEGVAKILIGFRTGDNDADDPLLFSYAKALLRLKLLGVRDLLVALLRTSRFSGSNISSQSDRQALGLPTCEERMFNMLTQMYMTSELSYQWSDLHGLVFAVALWMHEITEYEMGKQLQGGALYSADVSSFNTYEAMAAFALTLLSTPAFREVTEQSWWKKRRVNLVTEMENFDSHVLQCMQSQFAGRLSALTSIPPFLETKENGDPIFTDNQILHAIQDLPIVNTRAGLYIWLNASLYSKPFLDDGSMIMYLHARHSGNIQTLIVDLLTASFDVLTNVLLMNESEQSARVVRSFICNKVPIQLVMLSSHLAPAAMVDGSIYTAFSSILMDALPPITAGATEVRDKLKEARLQFLQACTLHGIASDHTVAAILQEPPPQMKIAKYTKENLVAKYANNVSSLDSIIDELGNMHGNAGAIAGCIAEMVTMLCINKDTIALKNLCNLLIKRLALVDILLQHTDTASLLPPLCSQLDNWTHDQDQVEFTPAYEEFASILLFVFTVVHRYGLRGVDIGLQDDASFVSTVLRGTAISRLPDDLTLEQSGQLSKWIEGLYATDEQGETVGIGDEVMRPCPPRYFYELVPTLFEQSVIACKSGALSVKAFTGGLELLVEPFLLPSLVGGLSWLVKHSWEDHDDADILLQVLDKLLKPSSSSPDTKAMHKTVLGTIAEPLYHSLQNLKQRQPEKKQITALMDILRPYLDQDRNTTIRKAEVTKWTTGRKEDLIDSLRNAIREQVAWITSVGPTPPPKYTPRLFALCCEALGVNAVLDALISELAEQTAIGCGTLALDICSALVCAPPATPPASFGEANSAILRPETGSFSVRDVLRLRATNIQGLLKSSATEVEAFVRLSRRVDAQLAMTQAHQLALPIPTHEQAADQIIADLGLTDGTMTANGQDLVMDQINALGATSAVDIDNADLTNVLSQQMEFGNAAMQDLVNMPSGSNALPATQSQDIFNDLGMDMNQPLPHGQDAGGTNSNEDPNAEDDIFAGLDMGNLDDFAFT